MWLLQMLFGLDVLVWSMLLPIVVGWHVSSTRFIQAQAGLLRIGAGLCIWTSLQQPQAWPASVQGLSVP
jgi:hypothetical protein